MKKTDPQLALAYAQLHKYEREVKTASGVWKQFLNEKIAKCRATIAEMESK